VGVCAHPGAAAGLAYKTAGGRGGVAPRRAVTWTAVSRGVVPRECVHAKSACAVIGGVGVWLGLASRNRIWYFTALCVQQFEGLFRESVTWRQIQALPGSGSEHD
jgi:hypothetical protein